MAQKYLLNISDDSHLMKLIVLVFIFRLFGLAKFKNKKIINKI